MRALLVPCGKLPRFIDVEGLKGLQAAVGGYIEPIPWLFDDEPTVYVNEEGKYRCLPNRAVYATREMAEGHVGADGERISEGQLLDIIFGDFVCIGFDRATGEDRDLTDEEADRVFEAFGSAKSVYSGYREAMRIVAERG